MENRGEVCLEEEVDRLRRSGMGVREIADSMGLQPAWVAEIVGMTPDEESPGAEEDPPAQETASCRVARGS